MRAGARQGRVIISGLIVLAVLVLAGCQTLPLPAQPTLSPAVAAAEAGAVASFVDSVLAPGAPGPSAYWLVDRSQAALEARLAMLDGATQSLDIQYFLWQDDTSGQFFLDRLLRAADRGVRVRLLLDDVQVFQRDQTLLAMAEHPNVSVRLFNPWRTRNRILRAMEFLARPGQLNHRLHKKLIVADGRLGLVGGRNIGDRYFGMFDVFVQNDLDILFAGAEVDAASRDFQRDFEAIDSIPIAAFARPEPGRPGLAGLRAQSQAREAGNAAALEALAGGFEPAAWFRLRRDDALYGAGDYWADDPAIRVQPPAQLRSRLVEMLTGAREEVMISTAYLVPDAELLARLQQLVAQGVRVRILTNSMPSNNHMLAHVAYRKWRPRLLAAGVELYELKPQAALIDAYSMGSTTPGFMGLHSKAVVVDQRFAFVGTPNIDPRSLLINTESGVHADSPALAGALRNLLLEGMHPDNAWRIERRPNGALRWVDTDGELSREPANGILQRMERFLYRLVPAKNQS